VYKIKTKVIQFGEEGKDEKEYWNVFNNKYVFDDERFYHFASLQLQLLSVRAKQKIKVYQLETTKSDVAHLIQLLSLLIGIF
jgi:hypothetical protein